MQKVDGTKQRMGAANVWTVSALFVGALAVVPIVAILWAIPQGGDVSTRHIWQTTLPAFVVNTAGLMVLTGTIAAVIGVGVAWLVTAASFPGRRLFSWLLVLPLAAPAYIIAYLYTDLLEFAGPVQSALRATFGWGVGDYWFPQIRSVPGAALMLGLVLYPYVYLLARAAFAAQSHSQFLAARTLGMSPAGAFFRIVLPGARPAIAGGLALVLMETLADFGVADYFAIPTLSTGIFRTWFSLGDKLAAMKLAGFMLMFVFVLVGVEALSRRGQVASQDRLSSARPLFTLSPIASLIAILICSVPVVLGFLLPAIVLTMYAATDGDTLSFSALGSYAGNSVTVATIAAIIATALALLLVYAQRQMSSAAGSPFVRSSIRVATLGYALPGALLAVGLLGPLGEFDKALTGFSRETFGFNHGLLLTGTITVLIYALVVRFLTVSFNSVSSGMAKIPPSMDAAARSLGATPRRLIHQIHIPLLTPNLAAGAALVFIDVMRELPATLILRPFNFDTLATRVYWLASDERLREASTSALLIVVVGVLPVIVLNRFRR